ncbi:MAG TPA: peptidase, partial [Desulfosporosinus sp.]|nr:peptidase [Desulfosporosinus sp.]
ALTTGTPAVNTPQNQLVTSQQTETSTPSSQNTDSNAANPTPGSNGYNGGYGMMG